MQLTGKQIAQIRDALLSAHSRSSLSEMVRVELDETLEAIAGGENLRVVVMNLITWAERNGCVDNLIQGAYNQTPQNEQVRQLAADARAWRAAARDAPSPPSAVPPLAPVSQSKPGPASIDVFLSYSRKDADAMRRVYDGLRAAGLSVWIDEGERLPPGTSSWTAAIQEAIRQAGAFVVLLSPDAAASTWVNNEIVYAQMQRKRCYPILIAGDPANVLPIALVNVQWIDGRQELPSAVAQRLVPGLLSAAPLVSAHAGAGQAAADAETAQPARPRPSEETGGSRQGKSLALWLLAAVLAGVVGTYAIDRLFFTPLPDAPAAPAATVAALPTAAAIATELSTPAAGAVRINPVDGAAYVYVPAGPFLMGSDESDPNAQDNQKPQTTVDVDSFWIMRTEVTNGQYMGCVEEGACTEPNNARWNDPAYAEHPVTDVSSYEANEYAAWVGGRLPTEVEWEKACRSTDGRIWPWSDAAPTADLANFNNHVGDTTAVGAYSPQSDNPYGLVDMAGNVWEWTSSHYRSYPYTAADGSENAEGDPRIVFRGGSWSSRDRYVRCAMRNFNYPGHRTGDIGFRVVSPGF